LARAAEEVSDLAQRGAEAQAEIIASTRALLRLVGRAYGARASDEGCTALLSGLAADVPWIGGLSVVGANDKISCSTRAASVGIDMSDRDYVRTARQSGDFVLSDYLIERADNGPAMIAALSGAPVTVRACPPRARSNACHRVGDVGRAEPYRHLMTAELEV
jgi:hypothetical protein